MPCVDHIDVRILVDGLPLREYRDPDEASDLLHKLTRYVEVKAGQHFEIKIKWMPGFNLRFAAHLRVEYYLDGRPFHMFHNVKADRIPHKKGILIDAQTRSSSDAPTRDEATGEWHRSPLTFGALGITDDNIEAQISPETVSRLGSIKIRSFRARTVAKTEPLFWDGVVGKAIDHLPEKALKGKALKNNVKLPLGFPITAPTPIYNDYFPIEGPHGTVYEFQFLYRSRKILQALGCIPRSPSPPPDTTIMLERTEEMLKVAKQRERETNLRLVEMQQRFARAESGTGSVIYLDHDDRDIRQEGNLDSNKTPAIENEPTAEAYCPQGTKRARDENDDELAAVAPPPRKARIEIDLTDD